MLMRGKAAVRVGVVMLIRGGGACLVPAVVLDHVRQLDDELPLLILLAQLKRLLIFPAQGGVAALTVDVCYSVKASQQQPLL